MVPCRDDDDRAAARAALQNLDTEMYRLDEAAPLTTKDKALARLAALLDTPCFALAKRDLREPLEFDSALSLREWWWSAGPSFRQRVDAREDPRATITVTLPGQPQPSLVASGNEDHPLAPLLCPATDPSCGRETAGWARRTEASFQDHDRSPPADCDKRSLAADPPDRWSTLVECQLDAAPTQAVLPLGRFRAMNEGYFVITDRPTGNCGAIEVYDLGSGTAMRASSCPNAPVRAGRVPLATLREAAWMTAMAPYAKDHVRKEATSFQIPDGVVEGRPLDDGERISLGRIHTGSRHSAWTWYRPKNGVKSGPLVAQVTGLVLDGPSSTASRYAYELLRIMQDSFVPGCVPPASTNIASIPWNQHGALAFPKLALPFDFQAPQLDAARKALTQQKPAAKCTEPL